jgi:hypothetical protein
MRKAIYALAVIALFVQKTNGQSLTPQVLGTTGNYTVAGGTSLSFTTGETVVPTFSTSSHILTQGFQQPNDIYLAVQNISALPYQVQVYPNPTMDNVMIKIPSHTGGQNTAFNLVDVLGRVLYETQKNTSSGTEILIPMSEYAAGTYLLNITDGNKNTSTYKIIKIQ